MKFFIALILIFLSFIVAYIRASDLKRDKERSELLLKLSERLKSNLNAEMHPSYKLCENLLNENSSYNVSFTSSEDMISFIKENFSMLPFINNYTEILALFPTLSSDELFKQCERLSVLAEKGYTESLERLKKDGKNAFVVFPGIITVFILVLL